ncbi:MAG: CNNM domain-containing protein [Planctomycetota bacterium]
MSQTEWIAWSLACLLGLGGSALWSGFETGVYSVSRARLELRARRAPPDAGARRLLAETTNLERLLAAILLGNNTCNYVGTLGLAALLAGAGLEGGAAAGVQMAVLTPVLLVFGEAVPKELFRVHADRATPGLALPVAVVRRAMTYSGVLPLVVGLARAVARSLGGEAGSLGAGRERLARLLHESATAGAVSRTQGALIGRALEFEALSVSALMVPWGRVRKIAAGAPAARVDGLIRSTPHRWYPVVERSGRVRGVVGSVEYFGSARGGIGDAISDVVRLSPEVPAPEALRRLSAEAVTLAVVERAGRPIGVVALRDLLAPLLGSGEADPAGVAAVSGA